MFAILFLIVGIIGEYIAILFSELKDRPIYIVQETDVYKRQAEGQLMSFYHDGFWQCMDTQREMQLLETLWQSGNAPWKIWKE